MAWDAEGSNPMLRRLVQIAADHPCDLVALEYTRHLARLYQARVHLTTVLPPTARRGDPSAAPNGCWHLRNDFLTAAEARLKADGVPPTVELIRGDIGLEAIRVADLADLMVLGLPQMDNQDAESRHRGYLAKQLFKVVPRSLLLACGNPAALRRILVGYDGSADAGHALRLAADLAERVNATLHVVVATEGHDDKLIRSHYLGAQVYLEAYRVPVLPHLSPLRPGPALLEVAREYRVDLIALGAAGHEDMADLSFGNATEHVLDHSPCSILVAQ